jgi:hypothetical protein
VKIMKEFVWINRKKIKAKTIRPDISCILGTSSITNLLWCN